MSTDNGAYDIYRAIIHSVRADGKVDVRIPSLIGSATVTLDAPDGGFTAAAPGDVRLIGVSKDRATFQWLLSLDTSMTPTGANDHTTINNAITRTSAAGGGVVRLGPGTYDIAGSIRMKNNVRLEGVGDGTILKAHYHLDAPIITNDDAGGAGNSNIQVVNLQVDGNGTNQTVTPNNTGTGVDSMYFIRMTNLLVQNCYVHDGNRHNCFVSDSSSAVRIIGNRFKSSLGLSNISSFNSTDITIANNVCSNSNETGTKLDSCHTCTIIGNSYFNATTIGVYVTGGSSVTITGNAIRGGQQGVRVVSNDYNAIVGNTIRSVSQNGISIFQNVQYTTITGNIIRDCGSQTTNTYDGIGITDSGTACTFITVTGNQIIDTASKMRYGVFSGNASDFVKVGPNYIVGYVTNGVSLVGSNNKTVAEVVNGTYTPTLTGMVIGTGGSAGNTASYVFTGGPNVGDQGILTFTGVITFGTSGQTFPTSPTITIPSGFNFSPATANRPVGVVHAADATGANYPGQAWVVSTTTFRPLLTDASAASAFLNSYTTTTPFTWASSDQILYTVTSAAVRV